MPEQTGQEVEKEKQEIRAKLNDLKYGISRGSDCLDLIKKSNFQGSEALKVAQAIDWLEYLLKGVLGQHEALTEKLKSLEPIKKEVVGSEPEGKVEGGLAEPEKGEQK